MILVKQLNNEHFAATEAQTSFDFEAQQEDKDGRLNYVTRLFKLLFSVSLDAVSEKRNEEKQRSNYHRFLTVTRVILQVCTVLPLLYAGL